MKNETNEPIFIEGDKDPLAPGYIRIYEFLHGYEDILIEEYERRLNNPVYEILVEELRKEIDKELISTIIKKVK